MTTSRPRNAHFRFHVLVVDGVFSEDGHGEVTEDMLTWQGTGGFSIDTSVRIEGQDRQGIERLASYCARPPFALERLHAPDGYGIMRSSARRDCWRTDPRSA